MSLLEIRQQFIREFTGRYDLVMEGSDFEDNGADFYINAGMRWLDRKVGHKKSPASINVSIEPGGFYVTFTDARAVHEVWASNNEGERWKLTKLSREESREMYPQDYSLIGAGGPLFYTPANFRTIPDDGMNIIVDQIGSVVYTDPIGSAVAYNGIIILPPVDVALNIEISGLFFNPKLVNDLDRNFWTEQEPMLLIEAACRAHEVAMRNRQGVADYEQAMAGELTDLDMDEVEEEIIDIETMGGPYG